MSLYCCCSSSVKQALQSLYAFTGPDDSLFLRFKNHFGQLDRNDLHVWDWPQDRQSPLAIQADLVLHWAEEHCATATFPRADYRELCELLTFVLGGQVSMTNLSVSVTNQTGSENNPLFADYKWCSWLLVAIVTHITIFFLGQTGSTGKGGGECCVANARMRSLPSCTLHGKSHIHHQDLHGSAPVTSRSRDHIKPRAACCGEDGTVSDLVLWQILSPVCNFSCYSSSRPTLLAWYDSLPGIYWNRFQF